MSTPPAIDPLLPYDAELLRRSQTGPVDEYGNPTWVTTSSTTRCELQQVGAREELDTAVQITTWRIFLPAQTPAAGWDAVRVLSGPLTGRVLELEGDTAPSAPARTGVVHHLEAYVRGTQ